MKELNGEKIIGRFYERIVVAYIINELLSRTSHVRDKVKVVLGLSNYAAKKELIHGTAVDTSDLAAKNDFIVLKTEVDKLNINKLVNVPTSLKNLNTKVDDLDDGKVKAVSVDLKKLSDIEDNEVVNNTKLNTLKTKVNNLEIKILMQLP